MPSPEILSALTTPFTPDGNVDLDVFHASLQRLAGTVDGVFVAGTTGEFPSLSVAEHASLVTASLEAFGADKVVVHVGAPSTAQSLGLAKEAGTLGAVRFAALTPYYLPASTKGILRHWAAINEACEGELYGYVYPDVAVTDLVPSDLPEVVKSGIAGIKVSATASTRVTEYLSHAPDEFKLWSGNDADVPNVMAAGGVGAVSGVSSVCPAPWGALRDALAADDAVAAAAAQDIITAIVPVLGSSIANLKYALHLQGLGNGECRMVVDEPSQSTRDQIATAVALATK